VLLIKKNIYTDLSYKLLRFTGDISSIKVNLSAITGVMQAKGAYK